MTATPAVFAPVGANLVPPGYVGWVLVTTPCGRQKVRHCTALGHLYRDSRCADGSGRHVAAYAGHCVVEPITLGRSA